ncbi:MAG: Ribulose-phosphate 3-epimerase [Chloroflexi bacterium ADurb.Bin325]|nr:MAG: Ribulose-phosphate 3-epimerase [Chloroflexi bacterium ADurb.Bin325]
MLKIAPSILAADFASLGIAVQAAEAAGADYIHVDVMDGHFVPNITIGPPVVTALRKVTRLPLDVHLMIEAPERYLADFARAGADILTVHVETCPHLHRTVQQIRELGARPGVTLNPATSLEAVREILPFVDQILVMTVNPGFGGQRYIPTMTAKVARLATMIRDTGRAIDIEVDGGIDHTTIGEVAAAGATIFVAGTAIFGHPDGIAEGIAALRAAA